MNLRPYQHISLGAISHHWRSGHRGAVLALPTGAGKTFTAAAIVSRAIARGQSVLWLAHLDLLIGQAVETLRASGLDPRVLAGRDWGDPRHPLHVGSMQTLGARVQSARLTIAPDVIVVDEAHRAVCATYLRVLARWPQAQVLALTATPWRTDGQPLAPAGLTALVSPVSPDELVAAGVLTPIQVVAPVTAAARLRAGFSDRAAEKAAAPGLGDVLRGVETAIRDEDGLTLAVFAASVAHSEAIVAELRRRGVPAEHVDAQTDGDTRRAILGPGGRLASGETRVVSSVQLLDEGVDCPVLGGVVLAAGTSSSSRYLQRVGRGLRAAPGKVRCLLLDYGDNVRRHWWPLEDVRALYSLEGGAPDPERVAGRAGIWTCRACFVVAAGRPADGRCPACGHVERLKPVRIVDRGVAVGELARTAVVSRSERLAAWREIAEEGRRKGYAKTWALLKYKARFGHPPEKGWLAMYGRPWTAGSTEAA